MKKWVYVFNELRAVEKATGGKWDDVKALVGGKGAGLLDMTRAGVPATTVKGGKSSVTTAPSRTMAYSPTVTPGMTMTPG